MNLNKLKEEILQSKGFEELLLHLAEIIERIAQLENEPLSRRPPSGSYGLYEDLLKQAGLVEGNPLRLTEQGRAVLNTEKCVQVK
jgi:hypothetical protein